MKRLLRISSIGCICLLIFLFFFQSTSAQSYKNMDVTIKSSAVYIDDNNVTRDLHNVPYGGIIEMDFSIKNKKDNVLSSISFETNEGIELFPYYYGVLTIDSYIASENEYRNFINSGVTLALNKEESKFKIQVKSIGSTRGKKVSANITVEAKEPVLQNTKNTYIQGFSGTFKKTKTEEYYAVNIYDEDNELIKQLSVLKNDTLPYMDLEKYGYIFKGLNLKIDGSSKYYQNDKIDENKNFYAIYHKKEYSVRYYIGDTLYAQRYVLFGDNAPYLKPTKEDLQKMEFLGWSKGLENIQEDTIVYANIQGKEKKELSYQIKEIDEGRNETSDGKKEITYKEKIKQDVSSVDKVGSFINRHKIPAIALLLLWIVIIGLLLVKWRMGRENEKKN